MTIKLFLGWLIISMCFIATTRARELYTICFKDIGAFAPEQRSLELTFSESIPTPDEVDRLLRASLEQAVLIDAKQDITALAFFKDDTLKRSQYSGPLFYKASAKQILTEEMLKLTKTLQYETENYSVRIQDGKTLEGVKPQRRWLTLQVIFLSEPTIPEAYKAAIEEIKKVTNQGLDATAYVYVGDKEKETARTQMKDPTGGCVFVRYISENRKIFKKIDQFVESVP
jgi:hypothetical protein